MGIEAQTILIDRAKARGGFESYAALARHLGVKPPTMQQWRNGDIPLSEERIDQLAKLAGEDAGPWALIFFAESTNLTSLRLSMQRALKNIAPTFVIALCALGLPAKAADSSLSYRHFAEQCILCSFRRHACATGMAARPLTKVRRSMRLVGMRGIVEE